MDIFIAAFFANFRDFWFCSVPRDRVVVPLKHHEVVRALVLGGPGVPLWLTARLLSLERSNCVV